MLVFTCDPCVLLSTGPPAVDGGWSHYGHCSVSCDTGVQKRACNNPSPAYGGSSCSGSDTQSCYDHACSQLTPTTSGTASLTQIGRHKSIQHMSANNNCTIQTIHMLAFFFSLQ